MSVSIELFLVLSDLETGQRAPHPPVPSKSTASPSPSRKRNSQRPHEAPSSLHKRLGPECHLAPIGCINLLIFLRETVISTKEIYVGV